MVEKAKKFGAFAGVFTPSILSILGVILFLRLPWIVGQAGLWATIGIILVAHVISFTTGLSVSSLATDKRVGTGGVYYIISRTMGLPIGGATGFVLFLALAFSISLYLIGFAESLLSYFGFEVSLYTIRIAGSVALFAVALISYISTSLAIKTQYLIMGIIALSLVSVFFGSHPYSPPSALLSPSAESISWIALFAIFFPAATGFTAGVSMSGDLKNPNRSIPLGTIAAILTGLLIYLGLAFFFAFTVDRSLLLYDRNVLFNISWLPQLVIAGILGATLSSAFGSILAAPRNLQAIALDRILPTIFAKGHGKSNEPRNALIMTYLIAQVGILIGELNVIARIVTIFFIITYGFLNLTYTLENWAGTDFRPTFKIPRIVSIVGAIACIIVMIQLDVIAMIVASAALIMLFLYLTRKELTLHTGDTWNSIWTSLVKTGLGKLTISSRKPSNWRPNVLLFSGGEKSRPHLIEMGKSLVGKLGIFTNFELIEEPMSDNLFRKPPLPVPQKSEKKAGVFTRYHECSDIYQGIEMISKIYGFSGFEPNTVLMGWGKNTRHPDKFQSLLNSFTMQDLNTVLLQYNKEKGFGNYRQIDMWWTGRGRNLSLAVILLKFITASKEWRNARIRILTINKDTTSTESIYGIIQQVLDNQRMRAVVKVINNNVEQLPEKEIMFAESADTDLSILELPDYSRHDAKTLIEKVGSMTNMLGSCLLISASSFFDEIGLQERKKSVSPPKAKQAQSTRPQFDLLPRLAPASKEIITSEIYSIGQTVETLSATHYETGLESILEKQSDFLKGLMSFADRMLSAVEGIIDNETDTNKQKSLLRLLNDFSFHAQKQILLLTKELIPFERQRLERANKELLAGLQSITYGAPEYLLIKLPATAFTIEKNDRLFAREYKLRKRIAAFLSGKPVSHKVHLQPAVRYFLLHRRIDHLLLFMQDHALFSTQQLTAYRKILVNLHEIIEKAKSQSSPNINDSVRLEKQRIKAKIGVMQDQLQQFLYNAGTKLFDSLCDDLNQLTKHLDSSGGNLLSRNFMAFRKREGLKIQLLQSYPTRWEQNSILYTNRAALDFLVLALKSRISTKIEKYKFEYVSQVKTSFLSVISNYHTLVYDSSGKVKEIEKRLQEIDHRILAVPQAQQVFEPLFEEIRDLLKTAPERLEIGDDRFLEGESMSNVHEAQPLVLQFQKLISIQLGDGLIDPARKIVLETDQKLQRSLAEVKDLLRLMSFGMSSENGIDLETDTEKQTEQHALLIKNFHHKLQSEEIHVKQCLENINQSFNSLLRVAFEPLTAATIRKTIDLSEKRKGESKKSLFVTKLEAHRTRVSGFFQKQFVNLVYSKSEGMVWFRLMEQSPLVRQTSNKETLDFIEKISAAPSVIADLPFYYCTLFSGQAGIGDDFWVGMESQIKESEQAISRSKAGFPGALLVSGVRSSGKTSLSKMLAKRHFAPEHIHHVRAPKGCTANKELFTNELLTSLQLPGVSLEEAFDAMPQGKVIIIQDLGLWWERKPGGNAVIELLTSLIDRYSHRCLFIITINSHTLALIDRYSKLKSYALDTVVCEPFDARDLQEIIMLRHRAGGLRLHVNRKEEEKLTAWDFARLFNRFFDLSYGNPGTAISLWLASITKVSGKTIYVTPPVLPSLDVFNHISNEQWFYIMQFVIHRRFSVDTLSENISLPKEKVYADIRQLVRAGILVERFHGIYAIKPGLDLFLTDKLKTLKHL